LDATVYAEAWPASCARVTGWPRRSAGIRFEVWGDDWLTPRLGDLGKVRHKCNGLVRAKGGYARPDLVTAIRAVVPLSDGEPDEAVVAEGLRGPAQSSTAQRPSHSLSTSCARSAATSRSAS